MALHCVLYVCVAASLLPAIIAARKTAMSRHQLELKEHYEHLAKVAEFECDLPQPRLLAVNELLSDFQMRGKAYFPEVTVLHRCDRHTGSCNDAAHKCGPTHATTVKMPFKVTFLEEMAGHAKGEWEMEYHALENHTTCGCLKYEGPQPSKTVIHHHYIDPSLMPPQNFLPLEPQTNSPGNATSYEVPVYPNNTQETDSKTSEVPENYKPSSFDGNTGPSIYDMTKMAEQEITPITEDEGRPKPDGDSQYQGFGGYPSSEPSTGNELSPSPSPSPTPEVSHPDECDSCGDYTTIPSDLLRFGSEDSPKSEALRSADLDSPYDTYLKQAFS